MNEFLKNIYISSSPPHCYTDAVSVVRQVGQMCLCVTLCIGTDPLFIQSVFLSGEMKKISPNCNTFNTVVVVFLLKIK